jgi:hypothetical protein
MVQYMIGDSVNPDDDKPTFTAKLMDGRKYTGQLHQLKYLLESDDTVAIMYRRREHIR